MSDVVKNYVVWTNCEIETKDLEFGFKGAGNESTRAAYDKMFAISKASARKFLVGPFEEIVITDPAPTRVEMFKQNWQRVWDLWHKEPCNILYLDSDTMFMRDTQIFGQFEEFRLFNWTDPKSNNEFLNYYNAGVRYYPSTMSNTTWAVGGAEADRWNLKIWDQEQIIFNRMFWSQAIPFHDRHRPELNWQAIPNLPGPNLQRSQELWNCTPIARANIVHTSGSRGAEAIVGFMANIAKQLNLQY